MLVNQSSLTPLTLCIDFGTKNVGGGKANSHGTPQGGAISPLLSNCYPLIRGTTLGKVAVTCSVKIK